MERPQRYPSRYRELPATGWRARSLALLLVGAFLCLLAATALPQEAVLPVAAQELLTLPRLSAVSADPRGHYLLLVHERGLLPLEQLRQPSVTVAGHRLDTATGGPHAPIAYFGLTLFDHDTGQAVPIRLPDSVTIGYPLWAPDGSRFAFSLTTPTRAELWIGNPATASAERLVDAALNTVHGAPCDWTSDSRYLLCQMIPDQRAPLAAGVMAEAISPARLADAPSAVDRDLVEYFLRSQAELIHSVSGERKRIGPQAIFESITPAPNGQYFLASRMAPTYSTLGGIEGWDRVLEIWGQRGDLTSTLSRTADGHPATLKAASWRATAPATVVWVERQAGHERVVALPAPFDASATEIYRTKYRYAGLAWLENSSLALVNEFDPEHRITRAWLVDSENPKVPVRRLGSRSVDAAFPALGRLIARSNNSGKSVVRVQDGAVFIVTRSGENSYLERIELDSMSSDIIWESAGVGYERVVDLVSSEGNLLLTQFESANEPPNYRIHDLRTGSTWSLTSRTHPAPELANTRRMALHYQRADGLELSATLYVPPGAASDASLPLLIWAYPRQYGQGSAPVLANSQERFPDAERAFKLSFLLSGYAVLDDVSMPVVGNTESANDSFLEQIVENARAAIRAAANTGYVDSTRVGVAGHSYGAFMVANLLAHTRLFAAGVAMSGSYNRTLTPFGFQTERRTLWEARDTYLAMSPLLYSDQIRSPLLLVHGVLDDNSGTPAIQSQYLYEAIRHNGGEAQLLLLPFEGHAYRARESVFLTANAMLDWFDKHLKRSEIAEEAMAAVDGRLAVEF